ncbi:MAG: dockerin type I domain-containing protein [Planctomycetota bacterium]
MRISSQPGLAPGGLAYDGEVEDYVVEIQEVGSTIFVGTIEGTALDVTFRDEKWVYSVENRQIASYPAQLNSNTFLYLGDDGHDTIRIPDSMAGSVYLVGEAGDGEDQVVLGDDQILDLTAIHDAAINGLESVDLREASSSNVRLDAASAQRMMGLGSTPLKLYYDSLDQVILEDDWLVTGRMSEGGTEFHEIQSGNGRLMLASLSIGQNPLIANDVDGSGSVSALDALLVIDYLNQTEPLDNPGIYLDVSGDMAISAIDALLVINRLNERDAEGEPADSFESASTLAIDWFEEFKKKRLL